jgi:hypothetical protein
MQLIKQLNGNTLGIAFRGQNKSEIEGQYFSLWNHEATSGELNWESETFAYITAEPEQFMRGLVNVCLARLLNDETTTAQHKGQRGGLWAKAVSMAREWFDSMPSENFLQSLGGQYVPDGHGYGRFEGISEPCLKDAETTDCEPIRTAFIRSPDTEEQTELEIEEATPLYSERFLKKIEKAKG